MISTASASFIVNLGDADRIPLGEGRQFQVGDDRIAVFRTRDGSVFATQASCTHKSGPLADSLLGGQKIVCPLHSFAFDLASGLPLGHDCASLKTFATELNPEGEILLRVE